MSSTDSITRLVGELGNGQRDAATRLWACYSEQLLRLVRQRLRGRARLEEEDIVLKARLEIALPG
jgi:hypothetical protein